MAEISVVIPVYNQAAYIAEAIHSVYAQSFTDWELVVVDDGSTDGTSKILAGFQDPRIQVVSQANKGVSAARNAGIRKSSAPLIAFLDGDDTLTGDFMSFLHSYFATHPESGLVVGKMQKMDAAGRVSEKKATGPEHLAFPALLMENDIPLSGVMVRREWLESTGGFDESMHTCEDWDLWLRMLLAGCKFARVEKVVVFYRIHTGQVTGDMTKMRTGTLGLWEKFFSLPNLPADLLRYRDLATASALVRTSARAFRAGQYEMGNGDLLEATRLDPSLSQDRYKRLVDLLRGWANDPRTQDPVAYLLDISKHVTPKLPGLSQALRRAIASVILESFFGSPREVWRSQRHALLKAISYDLRWLSNRGVLRMIVDSWFPLYRKK